MFLNGICCDEKAPRSPIICTRVGGSPIDVHIGMLGQDRTMWTWSSKSCKCVQLLLSSATVSTWLSMSEATANELQLSAVMPDFPVCDKRSTTSGTSQQQRPVELISWCYKRAQSLLMKSMPFTLRRLLCRASPIS